MELNLRVIRRYGSVPLYAYPFDLLASAPRSKQVRRELREKLRCFVSESAIWHALPPAEINAYADPPSRPVPRHFVVMCRGDPSTDRVKLVESAGGRPVPYSYVRGSPCFGFYAGNLAEVDRVMWVLASRGAVREAMVVNSLWSAQLGRPVALRRIGAPPMPPAGDGEGPRPWGQWVKLRVGYYRVAVFYTGTVRIHGPATEDEALDALGRLYGYLLEVGAVGAR